MHKIAGVTDALSKVKIAKVLLYEKSCAKAVDVFEAGMEDALTYHTYAGRKGSTRSSTHDERARGCLRG